MVYYDIRHIRSAVGELSGKLTVAAMIDENGNKLPRFDEVVLMCHAQLDAEIDQIISINYPHVHASVLEKLRELIETPHFKSVHKEEITNKLLEFNKSEDERLLTTHPNGFSLGADPAFLPPYFAIVEKALDNFKRIVNRHLKLFDSGQLPKYQPPPFLEKVTTVITDKINSPKLPIKMSAQQLATIFRVLHEEGMIATGNKSEIFRFAAENFELENGEAINVGSFSNNFYSPDEKSKAAWSIFFRKWVNAVKKLSTKKNA
jgi:hypothetical protein